MPVIQINAGLRIRPLRRQDLDAFDSLHDDAQVWSAFGWKGPHNRGQNGQLLRALIKGESSYARAYKLAFGVEDRTGAVSLLVGIVVLVVSQEVADVTVAIAPAARGRGIAPLVLPEIFDWCRANAGVKLVVGVAKPENVASIRMMEKAGMTDQGEQEAKNPATRETYTVREFHWPAPAAPAKK